MPPTHPTSETPHDAPAAISGIIVIDKPVGPTSMDCCRRVRTALRRNGLPRGLKVGHGGTLDPLAQGVVVVLVGRATRLCERVMGGAKVYEAEIDLARTSDSCDLETPSRPVVVARVPTLPEVEAATERFVGDITQVPPTHSAVWIDGKRAYQLARAGKDVAMRPRTIRIDAIETLAYEWPNLRLRITCGRGTYIRSLARDLGAHLNCGGLLTGLRRTRVGSIDLSLSIPLDALPRIFPLDRLLPDSILG
ncbi:MAG: tRNA pseudouridine(55) synthase TruB [Phycisphaeraceae bacterium]|nr:tRNA pseudouridine(55) synthase TruB [Phycisphaeraceae bacterium]